MLDNTPSAFFIRYRKWYRCDTNIS